ncbi:hypothetical protein [Sulfurimonas microaerophilic]|uniref:hypothetical protein n=1 Tax=Sulfurimonas microaerophilic TaxID=3058392 RepID=UPI00271517F1|nr:hypothetical protein [Sulfurimonas sp. hsl 1-7]
MQVTEDGVLKLFNRFGLFSLLVIFLPFSLNAQSFADFKRTQVSSFKSFKDEKDREFNNYLKEQWQEYEAFASLKPYEKPKPKNIEEVQEVKTKEIGPRIDIVLDETPDLNKTIATSLKSAKKDLQLNFFGTSLGFNIDHNIKEARFYPKNQNGIISFFGALASSDYNNLVHNIEKVSQELQLNDWGVYQLITQLSKQIYTKPDEEKLFRWFLLNKLSYDVKVGLVRNHVVLLENTKQIVYSTPRYKIEGVYYYAVDRYSNKERLGRLYTYEKNYPDADKQLDFSMNKTPKLAENIKDKTLSFQNQGETISVDLKINKNLIDFMATYPQVDYDVYFNAALDNTLYNELAQELRKKINGKKASYGLNFVLHFVQKSFQYQRDDEQFGKDKVMFAEETLFYDRSDCEDRAILYAKLVKKLFNYSVVGVKYKDHMSTALAVPINGDSVKVGSKRYVVADPTYINANMGNSMPKYKNIQPESFIRLK